MRYLKYLILSLIITFLTPAIVMASTPLHDEPPGTIINFSSKKWVILEQMDDGTTYILIDMNTYHFQRAFDPNQNDKYFNPSDTNNIGYYLNNDFFNGLSQNNLIVTHSWDIKFPDGTGSQSNAEAKIGLISYSEYMAYSTYYNGNILPQKYGYNWWTRTPSKIYTSSVFVVYISGDLSENTSCTNIYCQVVPALYLKSGLLLTEAKDVIDPDNVPPAIPTGLAGHAISDTEVQLNWNENTENDLAGYRVYRNGTQIAEVSTNSYEETGLTEDTTYSYQVSSYDNSGNESAKCAEVLVITNEAIHPPSDLKITNLTDITARAEWDPVDNADEYKIYLNEILAGTTSQTFYEFTGMEPETNYMVTVTTIVGDQESDQPEPLEFTTLAAPTEPPAKPDLSATSILGASYVWLTWDNDGQGILKWEVYMNGSLTEELPGDSEGIKISGLDNGNYSFKVRAINSVGAGEYSDTSEVKVVSLVGFMLKIADIFTILGLLIKSMWPLLAFGLALIVTPRLIRILYTTLVARR